MAQEELQPGTDTPAPEPTLDMDAAVADIASALHMTEAEEKPTGQEAGGAEATEGGAEAKPVEEKPEQGELPVGEKAAPPVPATGEWTPSTWRKEAQAEWASLPPTIKAEVQKRENDIAEYVGRTNVSVKIAQGFEKVVEPYAQLYQQYGVNPWNHMQNLLATHHTMLFGTPQQKASIFTEIAKNAGLDLAALAAGQPSGANPYLDQVRELQKQIAELRQGVSHVTGTVQEARLNELTESVVQFAQDPKNAYFEDVAEDIKAIIEAKGARTLQEAYEKAIWNNPQVRQKLIDQQLAERQGAEDKADAAHVGRARKALAGMPKSSGKGRATSPPETVDQTLEKTLAKIRARDAA